MSDPQPPAWNPENRPYDAPPPHLPRYAPQQEPPQYGAPQQPPYGAPGAPSAPQQPPYGAAGTPQQPPYGAAGTPQQPPYGAAGTPQQPQYGAPQQQPPNYEPAPTQRLPYGAPPPQQPYYGQPPQPPQPPQPGHRRGPARSRAPWFVVTGIVLLVALVGGGVFLATRGDDQTDAGGPMPTATYSDGLTSGSPSPTGSASPSAPPSYTPEPPATPTQPPERRRTLKDIDQGIPVYDDVYVKPAPGWQKMHQSKYSVTLLKPGKAAAYVWVSPAGFPADRAAPQAADAVIAIDHLVGARKDPVEVVTEANSNIESQAQISFSGRIHTKVGASISMVARCTVMTGVESIHNVTVMVCFEGRKDDPTAAFRDMPRTLASVARSI